MNLIHGGILLLSRKPIGGGNFPIFEATDQGEVYLTDTVPCSIQRGTWRVARSGARSHASTTGFRLAQCEAVLQDRLRRHWMAAKAVSFCPDRRSAASAMAVAFWA